MVFTRWFKKVKNKSREGEIEMEKLQQYLDSGEYLPDFLEDFHDQKTLFKRLDRIVKARNDSYTKDVNWVSGQVYTIDIFLWFMAKHGYTLQKSRKKVLFHDIHEELEEYENESREIRAKIMKEMLSNTSE